jgi:predicted dehydrogenase
LGAGSIGIRGVLQHLAVGTYSDRVRLAAVCDTVPGRARAAADRYGAVHAFETVDALLGCDEVDLVTLCTPIGLHYEQGAAAIEAGKHLHFNKTMTTTTSEASDLIDRARQRGVELVASPGQMLRRHLREIRRLVGEGAIGRVAWAATGAAFGTYHEQEGVRQGTDVLSNINPAWYWRRPGGGPLYDMTVYGLHALTGILGPAIRVTAMSGILVKEREFRGQVFPSDCDDNTGILLDFGGAVFAFVYGTAAGNVVHHFGSPSIFGTKGAIVGEALNGAPIEYPGRGQDSNSLLPHYRPEFSTEEFHVFEDILQLVDRVRDGTPTVSTAEHARHVVEIIEAAYRAAETGETQSLTTQFAPDGGS